MQATHSRVTSKPRQRHTHGDQEAGGSRSSRGEHRLELDLTLAPQLAGDQVPISARRFVPEQAARKVPGPAVSSIAIGK